MCSLSEKVSRPITNSISLETVPQNQNTEDSELFQRPFLESVPKHARDSPEENQNTKTHRPNHEHVPRYFRFLLDCHEEYAYGVACVFGILVFWEYAHFRFRIGSEIFVLLVCWSRGMYAHFLAYRSGHFCVFLDCLEECMLISWLVGFGPVLGDCLEE